MPQHLLPRSRRRIALLLSSLLAFSVMSTGTALGAVDSSSLPLERGDRGDAVTNLQVMLTAAGYQPGPTDGVFGPKTEAAVKQLQNARSLATTGIVDQTTWNVLTGLLPAILLQRGDRGSEVRSLQQLLAAAGYAVGVIDGIFGQLTESAVEAFQADKGFSVTGLVDRATLDALQSGAPTILMKRGDRGDNVRSLQLLLASAGLNPGPIDGIFGGLTESAVLAFQRSHSLPVTGQVGQSTLDALGQIAAAPTVLYERGDTGPQVEAIQDQLKTVGFSPGPIDGIYGSKTQTAVSRFHGVFGLAGEGSVNQGTLDKLAELLPLARTAFDYGYEEGGGVEQWRDLVTQVFAQVGLDTEKCGTGSLSSRCIGSQIDNALAIMKCESDGVPMAVNHLSGTTGLFQHRPVYWADRVARAQDLFPTLPANATPYNPEHNIMVAALLVHESRGALLGENSLAAPWNHGPQPWGHWDGSSRNPACATPVLVSP